MSCRTRVRCRVVIVVLGGSFHLFWRYLDHRLYSAVDSNTSGATPILAEPPVEFITSSLLSFAVSRDNLSVAFADFFCYVRVELWVDTTLAMSLQTSAPTVAVRTHSELQRVHRSARWEILHQAGAIMLVDDVVAVVFDVVLLP